MNELSIKAGNTLTKAALSKTAENIASLVHEGEVDPLEMLVQLKYIEKVANQAASSIMENAIDAMDRIGQKAYVIHGVLLEEKETGVKYHYEDDPRWNEIKSEIDDMTKVLKQREAEIKYHVARESKTNVNVTIK